jgi:hypothetical protein
MAVLDHLVLATPDLAATSAAVAAAVGVTPSTGGRHVGVGTANTLLSFGDGSYLEIIGPDPAQADVTAPRPFDIDALVEARLIAFAARVDGIDAMIEQARAAGYDPGDARAMQRATPEGRLLAWRLTSPPGWAGGAVPFLIDWGSTPHPASTAAGGATLAGFNVGHPDQGRVGAALDAIGLDVAVTTTEAPTLRAVLTGPAGSMLLTG